MQEITNEIRQVLEQQLLQPTFSDGQIDIQVQTPPITKDSNAATH